MDNKNNQSDLNVNLNINVNINVNFKVNQSNWASVSEDNLLENLFTEIQDELEVKKSKNKNTIKYITNLIDNISVDFEPDVSYRNNVRYMIIGLVLCQILKQKTINIFRRGKEDREYLASFLMMKIQSHLIINHEIDNWNSIILQIFDYYKDKIRINSEMRKLMENGLSTDKIISQDILVSTVLSNKRNYILKKSKEPNKYE